MKVYLGGDSPILFRSLKQALAAVGHEVADIFCGEPMIGDLSGHWGFRYAWPLCDWNLPYTGIVLWIASSEKCLLPALQFEILRQMRESGKLVPLMIIVPQDTPSIPGLASHNIAMAPWNLNRIINDMRNVSGGSGRHDFMCIKTYWSGLDSLIHEVKNSVLFRREVRASNLPLICELFGRIKQDFEALRDQDAALLCQRSINFVLSNATECGELSMAWSNLYDARADWCDETLSRFGASGL